MKTIALIVSLLAATFCARAQNPFLDPQFRGFRYFFEIVPLPNQPGFIAVGYPSCRTPWTENHTSFPTETQLSGSEITLTYAFWVPNSPNCFNGRIERYLLPTLQQGPYRLTIRARLISGASSVPDSIVETRTMAQLNFVVGEPLAAQVPLLSPIGMALSCLMMVGVGAFVSGRRGT
jgi:hypothetical protein